jgi:undecaprenol kinase
LQTRLWQVVSLESADTGASLPVVEQGMIKPTKNLSFPRRVAFAVAGFAHALRAERSLRAQLGALVGAVAVLGYLQPPAVWWALVSVCAAGVIGAELFNTAIERLADHLHPDLHPQIRIVKDCAAAAVLCAAVGSIGVAVALAVEVAGHWR